ncbi:hypothetical protein L0F63_007080, partial [Massospora cicadina]
MDLLVSLRLQSVFPTNSPPSAVWRGTFIHEIRSLVSSFSLNHPLQKFPPEFSFLIGCPRGLDESLSYVRCPVPGISVKALFQNHICYFWCSVSNSLIVGTLTISSVDLR